MYAIADLTKFAEYFWENALIPYRTCERKVGKKELQEVFLLSFHPLFKVCDKQESELNSLLTNISRENVI